MASVCKCRYIKHMQMLNKFILHVCETVNRFPKNTCKYISSLAKANFLMSSVPYIKSKNP